MGQEFACELTTWGQNKNLSLWCLSFKTSFATRFMERKTFKNSLFVASCNRKVDYLLNRTDLLIMFVKVQYLAYESNWLTVPFRERINSGNSPPYCIGILAHITAICLCKELNGYCIVVQRTVGKCCMLAKIRDYILTGLFKSHHRHQAENVGCWTKELFLASLPTFKTFFKETDIQVTFTYIYILRSFVLYYVLVLNYYLL